MENKTLQKSKQEFWTFHIIRSLLSIIIVLTHFFQRIQHPFGEFFGIKEIYYVSLGGVSVTFFIFISGVFLEKSVNSKLINLASFYKNKLKKIYSMYWSSIITIFLISLVLSLLSILKNMELEKIENFSDLLIFLSGTIAFFDKWNDSINPSSWFVGLIVSLYLIFPFLRKFLFRHKLKGLIILFLISIFSRYFFTKYDFLHSRSMDWFPPSRFFEFSAGIFFSKKLLDFKNNLDFTINKTNWTKKIIKFLSELSFPIFLIHYPILSIFEHSTDIFFTGLTAIFIIIISAIICMVISKLKLLILFILSSLILFGYMLHHQNNYRIVKISEDGMWSWISDPRAIFIEKENELIVGFINSKGDIVTSFVKLNNQNEITTIENLKIIEDFEIDDHANPTFVENGNDIFCFFTKHANNQGINYCLIDKINKKLINSNYLSLNKNFEYTYSSPTYIDNKLSLFYRGERRKPHLLILENEKIQKNKMFLDTDEEDLLQRPYLKIFYKNGITYIAYTDGHPREVSINNIYFLKIKEKSILDSNNLLISNIENIPIKIGSGEKIFNSQKIGRKAVIWDIKALKDEISIAYVEFISEKEHLYYLINNKDGEWKRYFIANGGGHINQTPNSIKEEEVYFSGGISIDPLDIGAVFYSKETTCFKNQKSFDIFKKNIYNEQETNITNCKTKNNIRPYAVELKNNTGIFFISFDKYVNYKNYNSSLYFAFKKNE